MPYKLKKVKGGWQVTSRIHARESIYLIREMLEESGSARIAESEHLNRKTPTEEELAEKYGVDISTVREAVRVGIKVEIKDHTTNHEIAKEIALDHLGERLDYYDRLDEVAGCYSDMFAFDGFIFEGEIPSGYDTNGDLDHDYPIFIDSMKKSRHPEALTMYSKNDYLAKGARLFKIKGIDAGFAVDGNGDIISVHNNSGIRGLGNSLISMAKKEGGSKLDHFDIQKLNDVYSSEGFKEYERYKWSDEYAPSNWDYDRLGRPDVILRKI
jgi:hypothetical protein